MIARGTTPKHIFVLPVDGTICHKIRVIYTQGDKKVLVLDKDRMTINDRQATCKLTQDETLMFEQNMSVEIQMRILTTGGDALASEVFKTNVGRLLEDEVL